jgi:hypothetical protein
MTAMDKAQTNAAQVLARKLWRTLEPLHGMIYFIPEATEAYAALGVHGRSGYFASRSAPLGAVPAEVVAATFFNFHPDLVRGAMAGVWETAPPEQVLAARTQAADEGLRRLLGPGVDGPDVAEAAALARRAALACAGHVEGRPLYAGHAALAWPEPPHLVLWHAVTLLREFRGDGHIAALVGAGVSGVEAIVLHAATGEVPRGVLQATRAWSDDEWTSAAVALEARGWLAPDDTLTKAGRVHRQQVEDATDRLATRPWAELGPEASGRLRELARPLSRAVVAAGTFGGVAPALTAEPPPKVAKSPALKSTEG